MLINSWPNKTLLQYSFQEQIKDMLPSILLAFGMGIIVFMIENLKFPTTVLLGIQILCGAAMYLLGSKLLKLEPYLYLENIFKKIVKNKT